MTSRKEGAVVLPVIAIDGTSLYFMSIPPRDEDVGKKIESVVGRINEKGLRKVGGSGLPGGAREENQSLEEAAVEEWLQETAGNGLPGVVITDILSRLAPVLTDVYVYQERPAPTDFDVSLFILRLNEDERDEMMLRGAELAILDIMTGQVYSGVDGSDLDFRPVHGDLLYYFSAIANQFSHVLEGSYEEVNTN